MDTEQHRHYRRLPPSDQGVPGYIVGYCIRRDCPQPWVITPVSEATASMWDQGSVSREERWARSQESRQRTLAERRRRTPARAT